MSKKNLVKTVASVFAIVYSLLVIPGQVSTVLKYHQLKSQISYIDLELQALAGTLMPAKDIDTVVQNSGYKIKLATVMDSVDTSSAKAYNGEELESGKSKILEYIIETKGDVSYLLSYLSGYNISYSTIVLTNEELVLQIYCN